MKVTVCITTHNDEHHLPVALLSALTQTVTPYEVIIVDDGSDKEVTVPEWCKDYQLVRVRVVRVTNRGLPAARNTALMLAHGEGFLPLDADDWLGPTYLEKTLPLLKEADVVLTGLQEHGPTRNGAYMPGYDKPWDQVTLDDLWFMNRFFYCSLMKTSLLRQVGGYNPLMAGAWGQDGGFEDHDLWLDLMSRGAKFAAVNEVLFHYNTSTPGSMLSRAERNRVALVQEMRRHHCK